MSKSLMVSLRIQRQDDRESAPYWENFEVPFRPNMNVISALMEIQKNPKNAIGETVLSVSWEYNCLEEVCGACSMRINGRVREACSAIVD
jgi:succinate dehydrogenase / fumarate reductase iron-sulfur subunit